MTLADLILIIAGNLLSFWAGYRLGLHLAVMRMLTRLMQDPNAMQRVIDQYQQALNSASDADDAGQELAVERHGDQIYVYAKNTGEFLAQGADLEECLARIDERFPGRTFRGLITKEQADALGISAK